MKKTRLLSVTLSVAALLAVVGCSNGPKIKTVLNPAVAERSDSALTVDKVILTDSMTIIDFAYKCSEEGALLFTPTEAYIVANGEKYGVTGSKNIPLSDDVVLSETIRLRTTTYSLIFPPIPFNTDSISFYEREPGEGGAWNVKGIDLTGKSSTIAYMNKKDSKDYISKIEEMNASPSTGGMDYYEEPDIVTAPEPEARYNYYCPKCEHLAQATKSNEPRPNSGQCSGAYHQWFCLGKVGSNLYECSHCGLEVYSQDLPSNSGCSNNSTHLWRKIY